MKLAALSQQAAARARGQRGQTLVIVTLVMVFLLTLLGLVLDTVRLYILSAQAERAAEAGVLAGVLYMPNYYNTAAPDGQYAIKRVCAAVQQNGVTTCPAAAGQVGAMPSIVVSNQYQLQVTVTLQANIFFLAAVAPSLATTTVARTAKAEYLPTIQLGSRQSYFGDEADGLQNFWARVNGPLEIQENGDAYTPTYQEGPTNAQTTTDAAVPTYTLNRPTGTTAGLTDHPQYNTGPITNPDHHPAGYTGAGGTLGYNYEIYVPAGFAPVKLQIYSPAFDPGGASNPTREGLATGTNDPSFAGATDKANQYLQMTYSLYSVPVQFERSQDVLQPGFPFVAPSLDLKTTDDTAHLCTALSGKPYFDPQAQKCVADPGYINKWFTLATISTAGYYRLVAESSGYYGEHGYGLRLTDNSGNLLPGNSPVRIWAWNDMCVYFSVTGSTIVSDLAQIPAAFAGRTLIFNLFDPGDSSGSVYMELLDPTGTPVPVPAWVRTVAGSGGTKIDATGRIYNGLWLHMPILIPTGYNPAPGSDWWQVRYTFVGGAPTDTITINITLSGSPIHLVP